MTSPSDNSGPDRRDRLFRLLPQVLQMSDAAAGGALQALLRIMTEQADVVEDDVTALLDNWFIETCDDWATPYLAELVGYKPVLDAGTFGDVQTLRDHERVRLLAPRGEAADTLRFRRRKGTLLVLEEIARAVSGWPARAVESRLNVGAAWHARFPRRVAGRTLDLHKAGAVGRAGGPFDDSYRHTDLRRLASTQTRGLGSPAGIQLWAWRLRPYGVARGEAFAHCCDGDYRRFTFDPFGLDVPLFTNPRRLPRPTQPAGELQVPGPIRGYAFRERPADYYGPDGSLYLWRGRSTWDVPVANVLAADLTHWQCPLQTGQVAIDPERGRILCRWDDAERAALLQGRDPADLDEDDEPDLWVHYHTGFSADIGGGSYRRVLAPVDEKTTKYWHVGRNFVTGDAHFSELSDALEAWRAVDAPRRVVIQIEDDATYGLGLHDRHRRRTIHLHPGDHLEIRAAAGCRPAVLPGPPGCDYEWRFGHKDDKYQSGEGGTIVIDGVRVDDVTVVLAESAVDVQFRHTTLTPGRCELHLENFAGKVTVEHSILGAVQSRHVHDGALAPRFHAQDSILDGAGKPAFSSTGAANRAAYVRLRLARVTLFGAVCVYEIDCAADCLFADALKTVLWDRGLLRYCSIDAATALMSPSPTPPRYGCQPDRAAANLKDDARLQEISRVVPHFRSRQYGDPAYAQLAPSCPREIVRGAEDESEPGAFHDLYQPQREALLLARLSEYTLAQADARLAYAT